MVLIKNFFELFKIKIEFKIKFVKINVYIGSITLYKLAIFAFVENMLHFPKGWHVDKLEASMV